MPGGLQAQIEELWARRDELSAGDTDALDPCWRQWACSTGARPGPPRSTPSRARWSSTPGSSRPSCCCSGCRPWRPSSWARSSSPTASRSSGATRRRACGWCRARRPGGARYLERGVVLMPSYVNIGARVGANTMVDTWATVGSCAQVGANVHLSGGVGIGGVLEPPQAAPVIVDDDCSHRQPLHGGGGRPGGPGRGARRGADPVVVDPGHRRRDGRAGRPRRRARRGAWRSWPPGPEPSRAASSACPAP